MGLRNPVSINPKENCVSWCRAKDSSETTVSQRTTRLRMALSFPTRPVTVDCVIIHDEGVVLIKRGHEPFKGFYALPGGFVERDETVEQACKREVLEETGLVVTGLQLIGIYSEPSRDPVRYTVAVAFLAEADLSTLNAGDDASDVEIVKNWRTVPLAFDHKSIIEDAWAMKTTTEKDRASHVR